MAFDSRQLRVPARCLHPLRSGHILMHGCDTIEKLKKYIQASFDIAVGNQILLINKIRLENDRTYESYLKNAKVAEPVVILDSRICVSCKVSVVDLINAFAMFDRMDFDGGGDLSRQEIFVGLMNFGNEDISEKLVLAMINEADKDRDDAIGFLEFCSSFQKLYRVSEKSSLLYRDASAVTSVEGIGERKIFFNNLELFKSVEKERLIYLTQIAIKRKYSPAQTILRQGEEPDAVYFVIKGTIDLYRQAVTTIPPPERHLHLHPDTAMTSSQQTAAVRLFSMMDESGLGFVTPTMITNLLRKLQLVHTPDIPAFVSNSLSAVNFTTAPTMSRKYNCIEFCLGFRSVIEEYDRSITDASPVSRPNTSHSLISSSRSLSPSQRTIYRPAIRHAEKRVLLALKCNLMCHFDAHIAMFSTSRSGTNAAKRDYDRMISWSLLLQTLDKIASRAKRSETECKESSQAGVAVAHITSGDVFGAEVSRFGRSPVHVRLPSQTTAIAADFVECWVIPKSSLKSVADPLILILDHVVAHQFGSWGTQMERNFDWKDYKSKLALHIVNDQRIRSDAGRNGGFRYLELATHLQRTLHSGVLSYT